MASSLKDELLAIRERNNGELTPQSVVAEARNPDHPLHDRFEWNDKIAGEKYRLAQARKLIRTVKLTIHEGDENSPPQRLRAFFSVPGPQGRPVYDPTEEVVRNPVLREVVKRQMIREWQSMKRRYLQFSGFVEMVRDDPDLNDDPAEQAG